MLDYLKDKKDVGFFLSVQALMQTCRSGMVLVDLLSMRVEFRVFVKVINVLFDVGSVLDLNAFERQNKAEGLGMVSEEGTSEYDLQHRHTHLACCPLLCCIVMRQEHLLAPACTSVCGPVCGCLDAEMFSRRPRNILTNPILRTMGHYLHRK